MQRNLQCLTLPLQVECNRLAESTRLEVLPALDQNPGMKDRYLMRIHIPRTAI
jgi:hypothetical protein